MKGSQGILCKPSRAKGDRSTSTSTYQITSILSNGKPMKVITPPGGKPISMEPDEKLLVINDEPKFVVSSVEDVIVCIRKYAMDNKMTKFCSSSQSVVTGKDGDVMFLSISPFTATK